MTSDQLTPRFKKPGLKDPRLISGLLIIALSMLGVIGVIRASNQTEAFYALSQDLGRGSKISRENLTLVEVKLGEAASHYISADQELGQNLVAARPLKAGEILSPQALATEDPEGRRLITLLLDHYSVAHYQPGDLVDIWVSAKEEDRSGYQSPVPLAGQAEIHSVTAQESIIGGTGRSSVEVWVTEEEIAPVLGASNQGGLINLIPSRYSGES